MSEYAGMDEQSAIDVLRHLDVGLRRAGLSHLQRRVIESPAYTDPRSQLLRYLETLADELESGGEATASRVLQRMRAVAHTEDGGRIEGIRIELTDAEQALYGVDGVDLVGDSDLEVLARDVTALRDDLRSSFLEDGWG